MNNKIISYLMKNKVLHIGMIEIIRKGNAKILYFGTDGVFIQEKTSGVYMMSLIDFSKGKELLDKLKQCNIIVVHQKDIAHYAKNKFNLNAQLECFQVAYLKENKFLLNTDLDIKILNEAHLDTILEHYSLLPSEDIKQLLNNKSIFGGYKKDKLVGFIGNHLEGSIGILEIFPEYRKLGYGTTLECFMINQMLEKDLVPFGQIEINNTNSLALQEKLGFTISKEIEYWLLK